MNKKEGGGERERWINDHKKKSGIVFCFDVFQIPSASLGSFVFFCASNLCICYFKFVCVCLQITFKQNKVQLRYTCWHWSHKIKRTVKKNFRELPFLTSLRIETNAIAIVTCSEGKSLGGYNKAGNKATPVACGWAGAVIEVARLFGQEQWGQRTQKQKKK